MYLLDLSSPVAGDSRQEIGSPLHGASLLPSLLDVQTAAMRDDPMDFSPGDHLEQNYGWILDKKLQDVFDSPSRRRNRNLCPGTRGVLPSAGATSTPDMYKPSMHMHGLLSSTPDSGTHIIMRSYCRTVTHLPHKNFQQQELLAASACVSMDAHHGCNHSGTLSCILHRGLHLVKKKRD
jgi:hypothetical protein